MNIKEKLCGNCRYFATVVTKKHTTTETNIVGAPRDYLIVKKVCTNNTSNEYDSSVAYEHSCEKWEQIEEE